MKRLYIVHNKYLGMNELVEHALTHLSSVSVVETSKDLSTTELGKITVGDVLHSFEDKKNYEIVKVK